jgi:hypothetical protein
MVGHEAVRKNFKVFIRCGTSELRRCAFNDRSIKEHPAAFPGAKRQQIPVRASIREAFDALRPAKTHEQAGASAMPHFGGP